MKHRTILITGASQGIGLASARKLSLEGHKVVGLARTKPKNFPGIFYSLNLADIENSKKTLLEIKNCYAIDSIVNNVGITTSNSIEESSLSELETIFNINVRVTYYLIKLFLDSLKINKNGRIINISSRAALGMPNRCAYSTAKSAIIGLTRNLALDLAKYNINVNAIAPGPIDTKLYRKNNKINNKNIKDIIEKIPLQRIGSPNDIANTVSFLLSNNS